MVRQRVKKIVIHGCKVQRIWQILKDFPFKLLECSFDDLCNMRPGVVMKKYGLALSMGSFQSNSLFHTMWLGYLELLVDHSNPFNHFTVHHALPVPPNADHCLPWMEVLTLGFGVSAGATHSFLCFICIYRHHFSSPMMIQYKKCCL